MFRNRIFKVLTNLILLAVFCTGQVTAAPNNSTNDVKKNPSSSNSSIPVNDALHLASEFTHQALMAAGETVRVSLDSSGVEGNSSSYFASISADGHYVAFASNATNLVAGDTNGVWGSDVFVRDTQTNTITRVSLDSNGVQGNNGSGEPSISADGRYVAFGSDASNLVSGDTNGWHDVFVRDTQTNTTARISIASSGVQGNDYSLHPSISADGRYVAFDSGASNLVPGGTIGYMNVFVRDTQTNTTMLISLDSSGVNSFSPSISADGRYVAFVSDASNLVSGDTNGASDVFVRDTQMNTTTRISLDSSGVQGNYSSSNPSISADGRYVAFRSSASNLVSGDTNGYDDVFMRDMQTNTTTRISINSSGAEGNSYSSLTTLPSISADGRYVAFDSNASNLVSGDTEGWDDVFVRDMQMNTTTRASLDSSGVQGNYHSGAPSISADGRYVAFQSDSSNLVSGDTNGAGDVFVHEQGGETSLDLSVDSVLPVQVLEYQPLVKDKATAVKVIIRKAGSGTANNVSVRLNYQSTTLTNFFVVEPSNLDNQNALKDDNATYPLNFAPTEITKTIYFFDNGLVPTGSFFQVSVTADYLGTIAETDETNNTRTSDSVSVSDTKWSGLLFPDLYVHYFRTDWGNTPTTTFDNYYSMSNDFLKGVYPVAGQRFQPNKSNNYVGNTTVFRLFDGKLNVAELALWIKTTLPQMRIAHPRADRFIATVPSGWFATNTTGALNNVHGVAYHAMRELVVAEARVTGRPNGPSIAAHEIGHSYQLALDCEEYADCNITRQDYIGNYVSAGIWVDKRIPIQTSTDRKVYCFMGAYTDTEFWIDSEDYATLFNSRRVTAASQPRSSVNSATQGIMAVGTVANDGVVTLENWYVLPEADLSVIPTGQYAFEYQDANGNVLYQQSFDISFDLMGTPLTESPFVFTIPYVAGTSKIVVKQNNVTKAEKQISPNAPIVTVVSPNGGEQVAGQITIQWSGSDLDGNALSYMILFSADNGTTWNPIVTDVTTTSYQWSVLGLPAGTQYLIKVVATDGFNSSQGISNATFTVSNGTPPSVLSITRLDSTPTAATSVRFNVLFSEPVTGVDMTGPTFDDFTITSTGVTGASVTDVSGSGTTYTVTVNTGSGNGTLRLDVGTGGSIMDVDLNPLAAGFTTGEVYSVIKSATFVDVPLDYWANTFIERLYNAGITGGCSLSPLMYCPETNVNRAQMAVFLLRGEHGSAYVPPAVGTGTGFTDVPADYWAAAWIKQLALEGITSGCGVSLYCPETSVTRDQMAVFLLRAEHGASYTPPPATGVFIDVPTSHWAVPWIEQLATEGITGGCGVDTYCPSTPVTRAQMAVFLVRTFNLP